MITDNVFWFLVGLAIGFFSSLIYREWEVGKIARKEGAETILAIMIGSLIGTGLVITVFLIGRWFWFYVVMK